jgi:GMP synthase (glutamine-hydrolysing)
LPKLLTLIHAPWERPHRILEAFDEVEVVEVEALGGSSLPAHAEIGAVIAMGGPMNVDEVERYPALEAEREWLAEAVRRQMPVLGICLGAQLLARALGAEVRAGERPEIGFAPVRIDEPADPVVGPLAPSCAALHWHGDVFDLPLGAKPLASSAQTEVQAFRSGAAWGVLFHPEADSRLVEDWLAVPSMLAEATAVLGPDAAETLRAQARENEAELIERSGRGFRAFADHLAR